VSDWRSDVLTYWFALEPDDWWRGGREIDDEIRDRFLKLWTLKRQLPVNSFLGDPLTALAAVILFDQFPRNMFRGDAEQFATDHIALAVAKGAVERDFDDQLDHDERCFLYMPFQHSENLADQKHGLQLFAALGDENLLGYARKHHDLVERFGRFPHRNAMLGRAPRAEEIAAGDVRPW
jgi:uncharacterized protein (DUF924 family)